LNVFFAVISNKFDNNWPQRCRHWPVSLLMLFILALSAACQGADAQPEAEEMETAVPPSSGATNPAAANLLFNEEIIEGLSDDSVDIEDVDAVFWRVFSGLPDDVTVYPSENYYYFILFSDRTQIGGNIRLPAGRRERGVLSFGYSEFIEFASRSGTGISRSKFYTKADGVDIEEIDPFTYLVQYDGKAVTFHLHELSQEPPHSFSLGENEIFIERTFDESGYQFFLLYNEKDNYFFWVLNEEEKIPDILEELEEDLLVGKRSGFAFWVDEQHENRKVLLGVRRLSVTRNDFYDGPFDQLADNYAEETNVAEYMQLAYPALRGRIDKYGYYTDRERPMRVALSNYFSYFAQSDLLPLAERVREAADPYGYISSKGAGEPELAVTPEPVEE
jgi:hypothetical protein